jgi:hypothetical protein
MTMHLAGSGLPMRGRYISLSPPRRFISDLSWLANRVPIGVLKRTISITSVASARKAAIANMAASIPWTVIFAKAYALVAERNPELRQTYSILPWPHLYETQHSVASIMIERDWDGHQAIMPAKIKNPAGKSLAQISDELLVALKAPIVQHKPFHTLVRTTRLPLLLRRMLWWIAFNSGPQRHKFFGTFGISVLGHAGASVCFPVSPVTTFLSYGPFQADGSVEIIMSFDHRAMDGAVIAKAMGEIETVLKGAITEELLGLRQS